MFNLRSLRRTVRRDETSTGAVLTLIELERVEACRAQRLHFQELFGDRVIVTEELAAEHRRDFDWSWASWRLLHDYPAWCRASQSVQRELGAHKVRHHFDPENPDRCLGCDAVRRCDAIAFARRFLLERA